MKVSEEFHSASSTALKVDIHCEHLTLGRDNSTTIIFSYPPYGGKGRQEFAQVKTSEFVKFCAAVASLPLDNT